MSPTFVPVDGDSSDTCRNCRRQFNDHAESDIHGSLECPRDPEPPGHRGHPTEREVRRAHKLQPLLARAVRHLEAQGFTNAEAVAFIAGIAHDKAADLGETWSVEYNAVTTIEGVLAGRAAKEWSIQALILALYEVGALLQGTER